MPRDVCARGQLRRMCDAARCAIGLPQRLLSTVVSGGGRNTREEAFDVAPSRRRGVALDLRGIFGEGQRKSCTARITLK